MSQQTCKMSVGFIAVVALVLGAALPASGIVYTWTHVGNGDWNVAGNWDLNSSYPGAPDTAIFSGWASGFSVNCNVSPVGTVQVSGGSGILELSSNKTISGTLTATNTSLKLSNTNSIGTLSATNATVNNNYSVTFTGATAITASGTNSLISGNGTSWTGDKTINVTDGTTTSNWYMSGGSGMHVTFTGAGTFIYTNVWSLGNMTVDGGNFNYQSTSGNQQTITTLTAKNGGTWTSGGTNSDIGLLNAPILNGGTISGTHKLSYPWTGPAAGTLVVSDGTSAISAPMWLQNIAQNIVVNSGTLTWSSTHVENNQSITKTGAGTLVIGGSFDSDNQWGGGSLLATQGTTLVNATLRRPVTVSSGATLGGSGTITNTVSIPTGAHLAPGASVGHLTVNVLTLGNNAIGDFEFNSSPANDYVAVTTNNGLTIGANDSFNLYTEGTTNQWLGANPVGSPYTLFTYVGAVTNAASLSTWTVANPVVGEIYTFANDTTGHRITLGIVIVPEPATMALLGLGAAGILIRRRNRKA